MPSEFGRLAPIACAPDGDAWELLRAGDPDLGLLLKNAPRRNAHVVVIGESLANQFL